MCLVGFFTTKMMYSTLNELVESVLYKQKSVSFSTPGYGMFLQFCACQND